jgi:hypothetical protein
MSRLLSHGSPLDALGATATRALWELSVLVVIAVSLGVPTMR